MYVGYFLSCSFYKANMREEAGTSIMSNSWSLKSLQMIPYQQSLCNFMMKVLQMTSGKLIHLAHLRSDLSHHWLTAWYMYMWSHCSVYPCTCFLQIMKHKVDNIGEKSRPPRCRLSISWTGNPVRCFPTISHRVYLEGAKRPYHYFNIKLPETGWVHCLVNNDISINVTYLLAEQKLCCKGVGQSVAFCMECYFYNAKQVYHT